VVRASRPQSRGRPAPARGQDARATAGGTPAPRMKPCLRCSRLRRLVGSNLAHGNRGSVFPIRGWPCLVSKQLTEFTELSEDIGSFLVLPLVLAGACQRLCERRFCHFSKLRARCRASLAASREGRHKGRTYKSAFSTFSKPRIISSSSLGVKHEGMAISMLRSKRLSALGHVPLL